MGYPRLLDLKLLMQYVSLGRDGAKSLAAHANAVVRYGSRVLYDRLRIDAYIEGMDHGTGE